MFSWYVQFYSRYFLFYGKIPFFIHLICVILGFNFSRQFSFLGLISSFGGPFFFHREGYPSRFMPFFSFLWLLIHESPSWSLKPPSLLSRNTISHFPEQLFCLSIVFFIIFLLMRHKCVPYPWGKLFFYYSLSIRNIPWDASLYILEAYIVSLALQEGKLSFLYIFELLL